MVYRQTKRSARIRAASRGRILKAARRLFARRGFEATTMRQIAAASGTSIGNLYFYFANKDELLETLMAEARQPLWSWIDEAAATLDPGPARLALVVFGNALGLLAADRDLTHMLLRESGRPELAERVARVYQDRILGYLRENVPGYPETDLDLAASAWIGAARSCLEFGFTAAPSGGPLALAAFIARWNLRGLGMAEPEIEAALAQAEQIVRARGGAGPDPASG